MIAIRPLGNELAFKAVKRITAISRLCLLVLLPVSAAAQQDADCRLAGHPEVATACSCAEHLHDLQAIVSTALTYAEFHDLSILEEEDVRFALETYQRNMTFFSIVAGPNAHDLWTDGIHDMLITFIEDILTAVDEPQARSGVAVLPGREFVLSTALRQQHETYGSRMLEACQMDFAASIAAD